MSAIKIIHARWVDGFVMSGGEFLKQSCLTIGDCTEIIELYQVEPNGKIFLETKGEQGQQVFATMQEGKEYAEELYGMEDLPQ